MLLTDESNQEIFRRLSASKTTVLVEIGCGEHKRNPDSIGVDIDPLPGVDIVHNLEEGLSFITDSSVYVIT